MKITIFPFARHLLPRDTFGNFFLFFSFFFFKSETLKCNRCVAIDVALSEGKNRKVAWSFLPFFSFSCCCPTCYCSWKCDKSEEFDSFELQGGKELLESQKRDSGARGLINKAGAAAAAPAVPVYRPAQQRLEEIFYFILTHCLKIDDEASVPRYRIDTTGSIWQL